MRLERSASRLQRRGFRGVKPHGSQVAQRFFVLRTHAGEDACVPVASAICRRRVHFFTKTAFFLFQPSQQNRVVFPASFCDYETFSIRRKRQRRDVFVTELGDMVRSPPVERLDPQCVVSVIVVGQRAGNTLSVRQPCDLPDSGRCVAQRESSGDPLVIE